MSPRRVVMAACAVLLLSGCGTSAAAPPTAPAVEAGRPTAMAGHSTEFDGGDLGDWRWLHEVEGGPNDLLTTDVGRTVDGALHVEPKVSAWFERLRAPYLFREVEGDVLVVARVRAAGRNTPVPQEPYSLAGLMVKAPGAGADWAFISTAPPAGWAWHWPGWAGRW